MSGADLAGPQRARPSPDERNHGGAVVGCPERRPDDELAGRHSEVAGGVDARDDPRRVPLQRREQPREAPGKHRLAGAGRADHEQVMPARGGDLQRPSPDRLAAHVPQVLRRSGQRLRGRQGRRDPLRLAAKAFHQLLDVGGATGLRVTAEAGLGECVGGDDHTGAAHSIDHAQRSRDPPQCAVETQLGNEGEVVDQRRRQHLVRHQQSDGDGQIESSALLAQPGRRQVDGDALEGPLESARQECGADPVAGLPARRVGQPHDCESGDAVRDMDLDVNGLPDHPLQDSRRDLGQHRIPPSSSPNIPPAAGPACQVVRGGAAVGSDSDLYIPRERHISKQSGRHGSLRSRPALADVPSGRGLGCSVVGAGETP